MSNISKYSQRFSELSDQLHTVLATKQYKGGDWPGDYVDNEANINWRLKARHLLSTACGKDSEHYLDFLSKEDAKDWSTNYQNLVNIKAVFEAAREDFEGGFFTSVRNLVQSEVFSSELDQAKELYAGNYIAAAAVISGVVLETTLKQLCIDKNILTGKLDKMNADLCKAGQYTLLIQKRITMLADIRNNAAHGNSNSYTKDDVKDMIEKVEAFVADQL